MIEKELLLSVSFHGKLGLYSCKCTLLLQEMKAEDEGLNVIIQYPT